MYVELHFRSACVFWQAAQSCICQKLLSEAVLRIWPGLWGVRLRGSLEISCIYTSPVMALRVQGRKS